MEMPKPGPAQERFAQLAGNWEGDEMLNPSPMDPQGGPALGRWNFRVGVGGFFLIADYQESRDGQVNLEGHAIFGADGDEYVMYWFDSSGMLATSPPRGTWTDDTLVLQHHLEGSFYARYTFVLGETLRFTIDNSPDGTAWTTFLEGDYSRGLGPGAVEPNETSETT
jgi:Protein of unknown function (DUF1579)